MTRCGRRASPARYLFALIRSALLALVAAGFVFAGCGSSTPTTIPGANTTLLPKSVGGLNAGAVIIVKDGQVSVTGLAHVGDMVEFLNGEDDNTKQHHLVADDGSFDTGVLDPGGSFSFVFDKAGTFSFHDELDQNIKRTISILP